MDGMLTFVAGHTRQMTHDGETCTRCGQAYTTVYRIPDEIWAYVTGWYNSQGLLCPICIDSMARDIGIELYWEARQDRFPTDREEDPLFSFWNNEEDAAYDNL